jgi:lipopolysaccharide transport system ATP-binding protein
MSSEPAIQVEALGKCYQVYAAPHDRLKQSIVPRLQRAARRFGAPVKPRQYFQEFWALRDINFAVAPGETVGIIGTNGSGKSTLLQLVCGTLSPTTGEARVRGRVAALLELGSGFNPEFSGRENVYLNGTVLGLTRAEINERIADILSFADIGEFIDRPVKTYSSGMAMRLAFAVIAHVDADVLLIDEALAVGDAFFQQKCLRWLRQFRERGTVLFCSHDLGAVMTNCRDAIWLNHGAMRGYGRSKDVCEAYMASSYARATGLPETSVRPAAATAAKPSRPLRTAATPALAQSVEVFEFNEDSASFGSGDATITDVRMRRASGAELGFIEGGEQVQVAVRARANADIESPIIGFHIKDRLGQALFGDNTYLQYRDVPVTLKAGQSIEASFSFVLPFLRSGDYAVTAAIASGTFDSHVQHHWLHDAMVLKVHSPFRNGVMIAIPMSSIAMTVDRPNTPNAADADVASPEQQRGERSLAVDG